MKQTLLITGFIGLLCSPSLGCAGSSNEQQTNALTHQQNSDEAAKNGQYGRADKEQREAQEAHHGAVMKSIDEGSPIPPQPKVGDVPPAPPPR